MLVVDTSVLLAAADNADPDHEPSTAAIQNAGPLVTTALVVAETAYLIGRQLGPAAEAAFFRAVADGELQVETITPTEAQRIAELIETYADLRLGGTDASLVVIAERLGSSPLEGFRFSPARAFFCWLRRRRRAPEVSTRRPPG